MPVGARPILRLRTTPPLSKMRICDLKRPRWCATFATLVMVVLFSTVAELAVASQCQTNFEAWVTLSQTRLRHQQPRQAKDASACVPSEAVRTELLDGLARCLEQCNALSPADAGPQQTKTIISVNQTFIAQLPLCRIDAEEKGADQQPAPAAPTPAPTQRPIRAPSAAAPTQRPTPAPPIPAPTERPVPAPSVAAPTQNPAPARPIPVPVPPCLQISQLPREQYALINRGCTGYSVLAVVETPFESGKAECKSYVIRDKLILRAAAGALPRVNHECVLNQIRCTKNHISDMFPECD